MCRYSLAHAGIARLHLRPPIIPKLITVHAQSVRTKVHWLLLLLLAGLLKGGRTAGATVGVAAGRSTGPAASTADIIILLRVRASAPLFSVVFFRFARVREFLLGHG